MDCNCPTMWTRHHVFVFILTFSGFAMFHATRKTFSNIKDDISKEWTPTNCNQSWPCPEPHETWGDHHFFSDYEDAEPFLGLLDTAFLFSYAMGLYFSGPLGDRFELRKVLSIGMWLSGCMIFLFGTLTQWIHFYNKALYITLWCLNGLFQGTGWPCVVAIMGNWFGKSERGLVFGIWSANAPVGNIFGSLIASALIDYGYEIVFLYASFSIFCGGIVMFFGVVSSPLDLGLEDPNKQPTAFVETQVNYGATDQRLQEEENSSENETNDKQTLVDQEKRQHAINFFKAILLPGVIAYSLAFAFLKMVNYGFFMWLPYYVTNEYGWPDTLADKISIWYDVGNILGGVVAGFISDRSGQRTPTLFAMLICGPFVIWGYSVSPNNVTVNSGLLFLVGFFIGGACNVIATAVTADIGKQEAVGKDTQALATVTGIIDGTGSVGAGIGQYLVAVIQRRFGWKSVFYFFMSAVVLTLVCLLPLLVQSFKSNGLFNKVRKKTATFRQQEK